MFHHHMVGNREAQAGPFAKFPRRKVRLEQPTEHFRRHAVPGVAHRSLQEFTGMLWRLDIFWSEFAIGELERQFTPIGHGIAGVQAQVHQHLHELPLIDPGRPHISPRAGEIDPDPSIDAAAEKENGFIHQSRQLNGSRTSLRMTAELKQFGIQFRAAACAVDRLCERFPGLRRQLFVEQCQIDLADHRRENIVEIMGDAARQGPDELPALRLIKRLLGRCFPRYIPEADFENTFVSFPGNAHRCFEGRRSRLAQFNLVNRPAVSLLICAQTVQAKLFQNREQGRTVPGRLADGQSIARLEQFFCGTIEKQDAPLVIKANICQSWRVTVK
jgi:hypothetical protein